MPKTRRRVQPALPPETVVAPSDLINMAAVIPLVQEGAEERMLGQIMSAKELRQLNRPWETSKLDALVDAELHITAVRRAPSTIPDSLGFFLVADVVVVETGEVTAFATSSLLTVAALVRAFLLRQFPVRAIPRRAAKPGGKGYYAIHLEVVVESVA